MRRLITFVASSLALSLLGCDKKKEPLAETSHADWKTSPEVDATGPIYEDEDFRLTAEQPSVCHKEGPMAPAADLRRISVPIVVEGLSAREVPIGAMLFTLEDPQGHQFRPTLAGCGPSLPPNHVTRGKSRRGEIAFDVPREVNAWELIFEPFLIGRKKMTARVNVPALDASEPPRSAGELDESE